MGAFKLGKMTFGSLFKKPETVMYPVESKPQPKGLKGHIVIEADKCILCGMCDRSCSTGCITVDRKARTWTIDPFACVQCGYCVTVCPKDCLVMDPSYFPAAVEKADVVVNIPEQAKPAKAPAASEGGKAAGPAKAAEPAKVAKEAPAAANAPEPEPAGAPHGQDDQVTHLISLMDDERASRVRAVLSR